MERLAVPGKLFLIGEYGVIEGGVAFLCALRPSFVFEPASVNDSHPDSPTGRWLRESHRTGVSVPGVRQVSAGLGPGFGTSTAELIASASFLEGIVPETRSFWAGYRRRHPGSSGADLALQLESMSGRGSFFRVSESDRIDPVGGANRFDQVLLFQGDSRKKLKTHEDLSQDRQPLDRRRFDAILRRFEALFLEGHPDAFSVWDEFADFLHSVGRETSEAHGIRRALRAVNGVRGVKGCGAGLHDAFVVALGDARCGALVCETATRLGLLYLGTLQEVLA